MYYKKLVGKQVYLSPMDLKNEVETMTKWMNEDEDIAHFNGFYDSLMGEEKVEALLTNGMKGHICFQLFIKKQIHLWDMCLCLMRILINNILL